METPVIASRRQSHNGRFSCFLEILDCVDPVEAQDFYEGLLVDSTVGRNGK